MKKYCQNNFLNPIHNMNLKKRSSLVFITLILIYFFIVTLSGNCVAQNDIYKFPNYPDKYLGLDENEIELSNTLNTHLFRKYLLIKSEIGDSFVTQNWEQYNDDLFQIDEDGRIRVEIGVPEINQQSKRELVNNDFAIVHEIESYHRYDGWMPIKKLEVISTLDFVSFIRAIELPVCNNTVITKGDTTHKSYIVRREWPDVTGEGIKVGIISDGVDHLDESIAVDELPNIEVVVNGSGDEGTAMLEIIYDIAPDAELAFASHGDSKADMVASIEALVQAGCDIICDDINFPHEPTFENGIIGTKVNDVYNNGILYVSSVGNYGEDHYIGDYYNNGDNWHRFTLSGGVSNYLTITIPANGEGIIVLQWNDQYGNSGNNYDLYLYDEDFNYIERSNDTQNGNDDPYEILPYENNSSSSTTFHIFILNVDGEAATRKLNLFIDGVDPFLEIDAQVEESSYWGHSLVEGCMSVGAVYDLSSWAGIYLTNYSSRGPAIIYSFDESGNPTSSINRIKPDIVAVTDVKTYVGQQQSHFPKLFGGTSASAPHAAAVASLIWSSNSSLTNIQVRDYIEQNCDQNVKDFENEPNNNYTGEGIVNTVNSILQFKDPVPPTIEIFSPSGNDPINGIVNISINASDNSSNINDDGIDSVEIFLNGEPYFTRYEPPYNITWNTKTFINNNYEIKAIAYDIVS